jgi:hypothetical protein
MTPPPIDNREKAVKLIQNLASRAIDAQNFEGMLTRPNSQIRKALGGLETKGMDSLYPQPITTTCIDSDGNGVDEARIYTFNHFIGGPITVTVMNMDEAASVMCLQTGFDKTRGGLPVDSQRIQTILDDYERLQTETNPDRRTFLMQDMQTMRWLLNGETLPSIVADHFVDVVIGKPGV